VNGARAIVLVSLLAGAGVACLKLPGGGPSDGSGGSGSGGGGNGSGGRPSSEVKVCAQLFDDACEEPSYEYYLGLCENENATTVVDIADCFVPNCWSPIAEAPASCIQLAVEDEQNAYVAALMYDLESLCGSQLDNPQVRVVAIHAASISHVDRLEALTECLSSVYCDQIADCLVDPEVSPWWED